LAPQDNLSHLQERVFYEAEGHERYCGRKSHDNDHTHEISEKPEAHQEWQPGKYRFNNPRTHILVIQIHPVGQPRYPIEKPGIEQGYPTLNPKPNKRAEKQRQNTEIEDLLLKQVQHGQQSRSQANQHPRVCNSYNPRIARYPKIRNNQPHDEPVTVGQRTVEDWSE
jgi:hypothetical protein